MNFSNQNRRGNSALIISIIVVLVLLGISILACCGGVVSFGWGVYVEEVKIELEGNPVIQEHIGEISEISTNFTKSAVEDDEDVFVFEISGPNGSGTVTGKFEDIDDSEVLTSGKLKTSTGKTYDLFPEP